MPPGWREEFLHLPLDNFRLQKYTVIMAKAKKKLGRHPKKPADRLSEIVTLRMTPADHERILQDAKAAGLSLSNYLQRCWRQAKKGGQ